jgi:3-(3-hydroxy-phenyl)propionate hydroxylase
VCDPVRAGTYMRIGDTRYRWEFRLLDGERAEDFESLDALGPLLSPWVQGVARTELDLLRVTEYTFRAQLADCWRQGRIFLLGDAAHLTPPFIGQGMGAGMRDAMNLMWKLAGVLDSSLPSGALDSYEQERKPHARSMIQLALGVGRAMTAGGDLGNLIRRIVVPQLHRLPGLSAKVVDSRTPALRASTFVRKTHTPWQLAGKLCPNPVIGGGRRLDSALGDGFAIVTSVAPTPAESALTEQRGATVHFAAPGSELAQWLRRGRASVAVVRPDRTVMCAGRALDKLCAALPARRTTARPTE